MSNPVTSQLLDKIAAREAVIGVVGLGYVGLPLVLEFAEKSFPVVGFDVDAHKVDALTAGRSYIRHIGTDRVSRAFTNPGTRTRATTDFVDIAACDAIVICVPTPLTQHRDPDLSYVRQTAEAIAPHLRAGQLVTLESTTYPGTTEDVMIPILEQGSGLTAGKEFLVAYSPEREDPNNTKYNTATIPKVVGGLNAASLQAGQALYECIICEAVPVANCRTAEATKLMENIFRSVNIALVNELKIVLSEMDIDVWDVIRAASTKPFGYMPFYPGPGLGGHCIPIDPFYLTWKAREYGVATRFIELAGEVNASMPRYVVQRTLIALNDQRKALNGSKVLLLGLAYKQNVDDDRESPSYVLWNEFAGHGAEVAYYDPYCPTVPKTREHAHLAGIASVAWEDVIAGDFDVAVVATAHGNVDYDAVVAKLPLVVDTRGICSDAANVVSA